MATRLFRHINRKERNGILCGIGGILDYCGQPPDRSVLQEMSDVMRHRGPDDSGFHLDSSGAPSIGLVHRRLAVIDLSVAGRQPMANEDGTITVVFNGEIYNFRSLREELLAKGHSLRSDTDTETILHLYEELGEDCAGKLDGMFAFALWDARKRKLLLARDRMGKKPLYYRVDKSGVVFGSEIKTLIASGRFVPEPAPENLPLYLLLGYVPSPATLYSGVMKVLPGTTMMFGGNGVENQKRFWNLSPEPMVDLSEDQCCERIRELVIKAVEKRLISDVPLGAFLSGGIDSTIIVGIMSKLSKRPVKTFSIGFTGDPRYDETSFAAAAAKEFRTDHKVFTVKPDLFSLVDKLLWHYDEPYGDSSAIPTYMVSKITRDFVTVALNGDGGDEVFAGYHRFRAVKAAEKIPAILCKAGASVLGGLPGNGPWTGIGRFLEKAAIPFPGNLMRWITNIEPSMVAEILSDDLADRFDFSDSGESFERHDRDFDGGSVLGRSLYINMRTYLLDDLLVKMDRMSMANSLEARSPFLDKDLIEFTARLPDRFKLNGGTTKYILRKAFDDLIPDVIKKRPKWGFGVPLHTWFRNELADYTRGILSDPDAGYRIYFKPARVVELMETHMSGKMDLSRFLWTMINLELWLRTFKSHSSRVTSN